MKYVSGSVSIVAVGIIIMFSLEANSLSFRYILRGFKHCTGVCDSADICSMEMDEKFRWCVANCSHKFQVKEQCEPTLPMAMRPILPYETKHSGVLGTNHVSTIALEGVDADFIKQTADRRRAVGTAKVLMLVREQLVTGKNVQLPEKDRLKLADQLMRRFLKLAPADLKQYEETGIISDQLLALLMREVKSEIRTELRKSKWIP